MITNFLSDRRNFDWSTAWFNLRFEIAWRLTKVILGSPSMHWKIGDDE